MKTLIVISGIFILMLQSCTSYDTYLYKTPPIYYNPPTDVPVHDSAKKLSVSASVTVPLNVDVNAGYFLGKKFFIRASYFGNLGGFTESKKDEFYFRYSTNSYDLAAGYQTSLDRRKTAFFGMLGYGQGKATSKVREYDRSREFGYYGSFSRISFTPGLKIATGKQSNFSLAWRQTYVHFREYRLPDTLYYNKAQLLSDFLTRFSLTGENFGFTIFTGFILNGMEGGDRQEDGKPEKWRIARVNMGVGLTYKFSSRRK